MTARATPTDCANEPQTMVYLLTPTSVYDHGCLGIFTTKDAALERAARLYERSDGFHRIRVDEVPMDFEFDDWDLGMGSLCLDEGGPRVAWADGIEFVAWEGRS